MNKWMKLAGVSFLIVSTLAVSGCGEEKKYNEAKAKLQPLMEETIDMPFKSSKDVKAMQEYMDKHAEKRAEVDQKLKELGELANLKKKMNGSGITTKSPLILPRSITVAIITIPLDIRGNKGKENKKSTPRQRGAFLMPPSVKIACRIPLTHYGFGSSLAGFLEPSVLSTEDSTGAPLGALPVAYCL